MMSNAIVVACIAVYLKMRMGELVNAVGATKMPVWTVKKSNGVKYAMSVSVVIALLLINAAVVAHSFVKIADYNIATGTH